MERRVDKIPKLRHPLEENLLTSLLVSLLAVGVAFLLGIPLLCLTALLLVTATILRYSLLLLQSILCFCRSTLWNGTRNSDLLHAFRLAAGNDICWLGKKGDSPQPVCLTLLIFEGSLEVDQVRELFLSRVILEERGGGEPAYPRLRQRLRSHWGGYIWERDPEFEIHNHIHPVPSHVHSEEEVEDYVGVLLRSALPPDRALWDIHVLRAYGPLKDSLLLVRTHQALADGVSLLHILAHSLADRQIQPQFKKQNFGGTAFSFNLLRSLIVGPLTVLLWLASRADSNFFSLSQRSHAKSSVERKKKRNWSVSWSGSLSLGKVGRLKQIMRSTMNDVLMAAAAGSVRAYLQEQGLAYPPNVKVVVPVDLRSELTSLKREKRLGWKVASVLTTLPSGLEGAVPRLWATRQRLEEIKASADTVVAYGTTAIITQLLPQPIARALLQTITDKASIQFSNVIGPGEIVMMGGVVLKAIYPFHPPPGSVPVAITLCSYAEQIHLTAIAHPDLQNAPRALMRCMQAQVDQLSSQLSHRRVPGESRRFTRNHSANLSKPPTNQIQKKLAVVQEELQSLVVRVEPGEDDSYRLSSLKSEFSELIGELRRRSSIVEGVSLSFEDEEREDEFRRPRKRALSVVSVSRRNSLFPPTRVQETSLSEEEEELPLRHSPIRTTAV